MIDFPNFSAKPSMAACGHRTDSFMKLIAPASVGRDCVGRLKSVARITFFRRRMRIISSKPTAAEDINHEPIASLLLSILGTVIHDGPVQYHKYSTLMPGTCHRQRRSSSGPPRVIARPAHERICADRIDGGKTQGSVIGDTALLINHCQVHRWP